MCVVPSAFMCNNKTECYDNRLFLESPLAHILCLRKSVMHLQKTVPLTVISILEKKSQQPDQAYIGDGGSLVLDVWSKIVK